jgi:putative restriction endonuclease
VRAVAVPNTGAQVADQLLEAQNPGLALSYTNGLPVRVIRFAGGDAAVSPTIGYDGLYAVTRYCHERGVSGFLVWRYELRKLNRDGSLTPIPPGPAP